MRVRPVKLILYLARLCVLEYMKTSPYVKNVFQSTVGTHLQPLIPFMFTVLALFLLYIAMPNTQVRALPALWSAIIAALIWVGLRQVFGVYMHKFIPYSKLYGAMGLIPLTVWYIYLTWMIIIFGVQLSYTIQNLEKIDYEEMRASIDNESVLLAGDMLILRIMGFLAFRFMNGDGPTRQSLISSVFNLPGPFVQSIMRRLTEEGLVVYASDPDEGFMLQRAPEKITIHDVYSAFEMSKVGLREPYKSRTIEELIVAARKQTEGLTVRDICDSIKQIDITEDIERELNEQPQVSQ